MVRTQLYFDDALHAQLRTLASRQGRTVSDLVREAVARVYGAAHADARLATLHGVTAIWRDRDDLGDLGDTNAYVRRQRRSTRHSRAST